MNKVTIHQETSTTTLKVTMTDDQSWVVWGMVKESDNAEEYPSIRFESQDPEEITEFTEKYLTEVLQMHCTWLSTTLDSTSEYIDDVTLIMTAKRNTIIHSEEHAELYGTIDITTEKAFLSMFFNHTWEVDPEKELVCIQVDNGESLYCDEGMNIFTTMNNAYLGAIGDNYLKTK